MLGHLHMQNCYTVDRSTEPLNRKFWLREEYPQKNNQSIQKFSEIQNFHEFLCFLWNGADKLIMWSVQPIIQVQAEITVNINASPKIYTKRISNFKVNKRIVCVCVNIHVLTLKNIIHLTPLSIALKIRIQLLISFWI